ncbi:MAG: hypothetical protein ACYC8T_18010, partial [Myxococcaceae bacterium]
GCVEIAVVDLPHLSNFTDFDPFRIEPDVRVRFLRSVRELDRPDAVLLPGSRNVVADLAFLRQSGWDRTLAALAAEGRTEIVGVCGGFQMLGTVISDPHGLESAGEVARALGLLPVATTLEKEKTLKRVKAMHLPSGLAVGGYEIHHGRTDVSAALPAVRRDDGEVVGARLDGRPVWGTYLHGLFDADGFRRWFIDGLRRRRGLAPLEKVCASYDLEPAFGRLAGAVRRSLDIEALYRLVGLR